MKTRILTALRPRLIARPLAAAARPFAAALRCRHARLLVISAAFTLAIAILVPAAALAAPENKAPTASIIQTALYLGGLSLLPFAVMTLTSFLRIVVVLSFLRSGLGAQNVPPNIVVIALALFLTMFVMGPTFGAINKTAYKPYAAGNITADQALKRAQVPLKGFMAKQMGPNSRKEISTFYKLAKDKQGNKNLPSETELEREGASVLPIEVLAPAFIISELKKAFLLGFAVLLPFLIIDMVISNILLSLGMFMLPPVVISLPFKILLFVLAGGWTRVVTFLVDGFNY